MREANGVDGDYIGLEASRRSAWLRPLQQWSKVSLLVLDPTDDLGQEIYDNLTRDRGW